VGERSKVSLPQHEPSVYGACSHIKGEVRGKNKNNFFFEKYYDFLCKIKIYF